MRSGDNAKTSGKDSILQGEIIHSLADALEDDDVREILKHRSALDRNKAVLGPIGVSKPARDQAGARQPYVREGLFRSSAPARRGATAAFRQSKP
jgi:hypothetical protein